MIQLIVQEFFLIPATFSVSMSMQSPNTVHSTSKLTLLSNQSKLNLAFAQCTSTFACLQNCSQSGFFKNTNLIIPIFCLKSTNASQRSQDNSQHRQYAHTLRPCGICSDPMYLTSSILRCSAFLTLQLLLELAILLPNSEHRTCSSLCLECRLPPTCSLILQISP